MDEGPSGQREGLCEEPGAEEPMQLLQGLKRSPGGERQWGRVRGVAGRAGWFRVLCFAVTCKDCL